MLSAHSVRRLVAAAGIAGLGATLTATTATAAPAQALPQNAPVTAPSNAADAATTPDATPTAPQAPAPATYTVVAGDTLWEIAQAKQIPGSWQALYDLNRDQLTDPDWIDIGQVLKLAGVAAAPQQTAPKATEEPKPSAPTTSKASERPRTEARTSWTGTSKSTGTTKPSATKPAAGTTAKTTASKPAAVQVAAPASSKVSAALAFARAQLGKPYVYGAAGPNAYDCSGLVQAAYKAAGISLPRVTTAQFAADAKVSTSSLQPGDLVFYYSGISHVGIYIGDGQIIHAPNSRSVVKIAPVDSMPIAGATRPAA